jgi:hypothetical protein
MTCNLISYGPFSSKATKKVKENDVWALAVYFAFCDTVSVAPEFDAFETACNEIFDILDTG